MKSVARRTEVRIQRDAHLRLRYEEGRDNPPYLRQCLGREDERRVEYELRQADYARISQGRYSYSRSRDGSRDRG